MLCVECNYGGQAFKLVVAGLDSGSYTFKARCPQCEGQKVNVEEDDTEDELELTTTKSPGVEESSAIRLLMASR